MVEVRNDDLIDIPPLKWDPEAFSGYARSYDKQRDIFFVYQEPKRPAVSLDVGGHLWVRFDPETGDVLGIEIEDFERVFLKSYPEMGVGWEELKPQVTKRRSRGQNGVADYLRLLLMFVREILSTHPFQRHLAPG